MPAELARLSDNAPAANWAVDSFEPQSSILLACDSAVIPPTPASALTGIGLTCISVVLFAFLDSSARYVAGAIPVIVALWVRYVIQTASTLLLIRRKTGRWFPVSNNWPWQVTRACAFVLSSGFAFLSLRYINVAEFTAIALISPVIVSVLALFVLNEKLAPSRLVLLGLALAGAIIIIRPGSMAFEWVMLLPLAQVAANVLFLLITAHLSHYDETLTTHLYSGFFALLIVSGVLPFFWQMPEVPWQFWLALLGGSIAGTLGHLLLVKAHQYAPSTVLMPYLYIQVAAAVALGWLFFGNLPDQIAMLGIGMIVTSGLIGAILGLRKAKQAQKEAAKTL